MLAVVTGSSGGIGQAICKKLQSLNYLVIGIDCKENKADQETVFLKFDLQLICKNYDDSKKVILSFLEKKSIKKIDLLVNNAAYQGNDTLESLTTEGWQKSNDINVGAPLFLTKLLKPYFNKEASIINIGSIHSRLTKKKFLSYSITKASLNALTRALALDIGNEFRVNSIEPAAINTRMLKQGFGKNYESKLSLLKSMHPSGVIGSPEEVAELVCLLSSKSLKFLNGSCIDLSGGISSVLHDPGES